MNFFNLSSLALKCVSICYADFWRVCCEDKKYASHLSVTHTCVLVVAYPVVVVVADVAIEVLLLLLFLLMLLLKYYCCQFF